MQEFLTRSTPRRSVSLADGASDITAVGPYLMNFSLRLRLAVLAEVERRLAQDPSFRMSSQARSRIASLERAEERDDIPAKDLQASLEAVTGWTSEEARSQLDRLAIT